MTGAAPAAAGTDPPSTRTVLFTGKGGVGKTTLAAATAVASAGAGHRTLVLSTDPAHSLSDVLGVALTGEPVAVAASHPLLWACEVDVRGRFEAAWSQIRQYLVGVLAARGVAEVTAEELVVLPGADEILALLELETAAASGAFDVIVVDCAPTGETLRLLALPETLSFYADRLFGAPQRLLRALATGLGGFGSARGGATGPDGEVRDAVADLLTRLAAARTLLTAPASGVTVVSTAEHVVLAEARRAYTALSLHGYRVTGVVLNRLLPPDADGAWAATVRAGQQRQLTAAAESFRGLPVFHAPLRAVEPVGVAALAELAVAVYGDHDPLPSTDGVRPGLEVGGGQGAYTLTVPLPLADRGQVSLTRSGDDLVITVGAQRRRIALPSLLQRCLATGASFDADALVVAFAPDPARWPEALVGV